MAERPGPEATAKLACSWLAAGALPHHLGKTPQAPANDAGENGKSLGTLFHSVTKVKGPTALS